MIKIENVDVYGFEHAVRAMRNPMNSWDKSDSNYCGNIEECSCCRYSEEPNLCNSPTVDGDDFVIGNKDVVLMRNLFKAGPEHRTYTRMIYVWMDITAPLYWWKEMDRYTVGKSQVSCSTMHKIAAKEFELDDFSHEHFINNYYEASIPTECSSAYITSKEVLIHIVSFLNSVREQYLETKNKDDWWQMIQLLPSSYNQRRTICMSYETVFKIIRERTGHKLTEWNEFVELLKDLPYVREITQDE